MFERDIAPIHPGEILKEDFLDPLGISASKLAGSIGVPRNRVTEVINGKRSITADTSIRLGRFFGMSLDYWLNLQSHFDLEVAKTTKGCAIFDTVQPREFVTA